MLMERWSSHARFRLGKFFAKLTALYQAQMRIAHQFIALPSCRSPQRIRQTCPIGAIVVQSDARNPWLILWPFARRILLLERFVNEDPADVPRRLAPGWRFAARSGGGQGRGFLRVWHVWERFLQRLDPIQQIPGATYRLFAVQQHHYHRRRTVALPDGASIHHGDLILEIHLNNRRITEFMRTGTLWQLIRGMRSDLRAIAIWVQRDPALHEMRAIHGVSLLGRAAPRLGFVAVPRQVNLGTWLDRIFAHGLLVIYNPGGLRRLALGHTRLTYPETVWMSRAVLLRRYGAATESPVSASSDAVPSE
jgi:hypothetical protein